MPTNQSEQYFYQKKRITRASTS